MSLRVVHLIVQSDGEERWQRIEEQCADWDSRIPIVRYIRSDGSVEEFDADGSPLESSTMKQINSGEKAHSADELVVKTEEIEMAKQNGVDSSSSEVSTVASSKVERAQTTQDEACSHASQSNEHDSAKISGSLVRRIANIGNMPAQQIEELIEDMDDVEDLQALREEARTQAKRLAGLKVADSAPRCAHIRSSGKTCGSPAMKGDEFCYYHSEARKIREAAEASTKPAEMPILEDRHGLQLAIMRVCTLLANDKIEERTARAIFDGLRLAQKTLNESSF